MIRILFVLGIAQAAFLILGCSKTELVPGVPMRDGFEGPALSNLWETDKIVPGDAAIQSKVARSGQSALHQSIPYDPSRRTGLEEYP